VALILDVALQEFSAHGYAGTRTQDIARRAGLSQGGLYAHFASKEQIFEALLTRMLVPPSLALEPLLQGCDTCEELARRIVERMLEGLGHPEMLATLRLMVAESDRVPHLVELWNRKAIEPMYQDLDQLVQAATQRGLVRPGVAARHSWVLLAPMLHVVMMRLVRTQNWEQVLPESQRVCVDVLAELLGRRSE
jgi:AcrR family transcriptional regulator